MSELIDELMEGLDVNISNDTATKEIKDFKKAVIKSIDKFLLYIKVKSGIEDVYNFNDIDKLSRINNDLDKYMNRLKR